MQFLWNIHHIQNHVNQFFSWILITSRYLPIFFIFPKTSNFHLEEIYIYIYRDQLHLPLYPHKDSTILDNSWKIKAFQRLDEEIVDKNWLPLFSVGSTRREKEFHCCEGFQTMADTIYIYTHIVNCASAVLFFFLPLCFLSSPHLTMPSNESPPFNIRNNGFLVSPEENEFFTLSSR